MIPKNSQGAKPRLGSMALAASIALAGCGSTGPTARSNGAFVPTSIDRSAGSLASQLDRAKLSSASRQVAAEGIKALDARDLRKASDLFNLALKTDINNTWLHFFNALAYHYRAIEGEATLYSLAEQGYEMAAQFDASNGLARHYRGLLHLDRREYPQAQQQLMEATLYNKDDPDLLYDLAVASYLAKDPKTAYAALVGLQALASESPLAASARVLRARAIVAAAAGDALGAEKALTELRAKGVTDEEARFVARRLADWKQVYQSPMVKTQFGGTPIPSFGGGTVLQPGASFQPLTPVPPTPTGITSTIPGQPLGPQLSGQPYSGQYPYGGFPAVGRPGAPRNPGEFVEKQMVLVDVVIISSEEDNSDTMGVNLLDGLRIQFGNTSGTPAWSRVANQSIDRLLGAGYVSDTRAITRLISVPGVTYTLNIANAADRSNEVLARPTLVALGGQTSQFFSGVDVVGAAVSSGQGSSVQVQKEVGVKLAVTPEFLPDNLIKLQIVAERTFLTNPNSNVVFDFRLDTTKTIVNANVAMRYGETIILSGLSERDKSSDTNGVPGLRDVPVVQYLFSRNTQRDFYKNVLILLTPRRPQYTYRSNEVIAEERGKLSESDRLQTEFEDRYRIWFQPVPTTASAVRNLSESALFREFRTGDIEVPSWTSRNTHSGRLRSALNFLFF